MRTPRLLPMIGIAVGGVLAIKALSGVTAAPELFQGAKAFAEGSLQGRGQRSQVVRLAAAARILGRQIRPGPDRRSGADGVRTGRRGPGAPGRAVAR